MRIFSQSLILILSFLMIFVWEQTPVGDYTIQTIGLFIATYLGVAFYRRKKHIDGFKTNGLFDIFILNGVILLLIFQTGSLYSPLYFLVYFLAFGISFIFKPLTVFVFALGAVLVFLPEALKNNSLESFIKIGSVFLIAPLAYFFGQGHDENQLKESDHELQSERLTQTADTVSQDVEEVIEKEDKHISQRSVEKLNEILEETEALRLETKS